jgi:hypothetical protein
MSQPQLVDAGPLRWGLYRGVGASSMASVNRPSPPSSDLTNHITRYAATVSAFLPATATAV